MRGVVYAAWERCRRHFDLDPHRLRFQMADPQRLALAQMANARLIEVARPYMETVDQQFGQQPHLVALTDASAYVLVLLGDSKTLQVGKSAALFEGASWAEHDVGSNGAGTALAIDQPVVLVGREHYVDEYADWTCLGLPLHDPSGSLVGAIDISVPTTELEMAVWESMFWIAEAVERDLGRTPTEGACDCPGE